MTPGLIALNLLGSLAAYGAVGLLFAWAAWRVTRQFGTWGLAALWALAALAATALMVARLHRQRAALGLTPTQHEDTFVFTWFLPMWAAALGGVALVVWRHLRIAGPAAPFTRRTVARSLGAFVAGMLLFFLVFVVRDVAAIVRRM